LKSGIPIKIIAAVTAIAIIPMIWRVVRIETYLTKKEKITTMKNNPVDTLSSTDIFSSDFMIGNVGAPFVIGLAVGYFAKKMLLTALFLGGAAIVLLFVSEYYGITEISELQLQQATDAATDVAKQSGGFLVERLSSITSKGVSAVGGFFVGFKLG
jgi:uncharacterized membrane protein (Fun14 family)